MYYGNQIPNNFPNPNNNEQQPQTKEKSVFAEALPQILIRGTLLLIVIGVIIFMCFLGSAVLGAIGEQAEDFFRHLRKLFRHAPHMFHSAKGFGAFVELVLIAVFIGWVINRFRKYFGK